ncbi:SHOCT domain-containing protein [Paraherbaspirillum soli]|uniref:SHOCT domain-containing protein n=1 Tax=Paraherbaspirillum soli TaxID=631222 RepID=A0ABW0MGW4_9BURK
MSVSDELLKLDELKNKGAITADEFESLKKKLLDGEQPRLEKKRRRWPWALLPLIALAFIAFQYGDIGKVPPTKSVPIEKIGKPEQIADQPSTAGTSEPKPTAQDDTEAPTIAADLQAPSKQLLDKVYGQYDQKTACWPAIDDESSQNYCMKLVHAEKITSVTGERVYVLAAGEPVDEEGHPDGGHLTPGMVGAFILENHDGQPEIIASDPKMLIGADRQPPSPWKLIKLGASDYIGWQSTWSDCHQGYCGSRYAILAPYGKGIRDLAHMLTASYDNSGAMSDPNKVSSIETKLEMDASVIDEKVYPLLLTVTGDKNGKKLTRKTWKIPFDQKEWVYVEPKVWPLDDADF